MTTYGYVKLTPITHTISDQIRNILNAYPHAIIVEEKFNNNDSPLEYIELNDKIIKNINPGDVIVFDSLYVLSNDTNKISEFAIDMFFKDVKLVFIDEPILNNTIFYDSIENIINIENTNDHIPLDILLKVINLYTIELINLQIKKHDIYFKESAHYKKKVSNKKEKKINQINMISNNKKSIIAKYNILQYSKNFGGNLTNEQLINKSSVSMKTLLKYKRELMFELQNCSYDKLLNKYEQHYNKYLGITAKEYAK